MPPDPRSGRPVVRRDADGTTILARSWESLTERLIREAQEAGAFDDLPGTGRPLVLDDDPREGELGLAFHILRTNRTVPPWIAVDQEVRAQLDALDRLMARATDATPPGPVARARWHARLETVLHDHTAAVRSLEGLAPSTAQHRPRLDPSAEHARLDAALDRAPDTGPAATS